MDVEKAALELIELTYAAALEPQQWHALMLRFTQLVGTKSALLREVNYGIGAVGLFETVGYDPAFTQAYRDHFVKLDFFAPALRMEPVGKVTRGDEVVPWAQQRKTEFYNDYFYRMDTRYALGVTLARDERHHLLFALQRSKQQGDYTEQELSLIRLVAPHIARAAQIRQQLQDVNTQKQWALQALDQLRVGVILLDAQGCPQFLNREAERLTRDLNGLLVRHDGLSLYSPAHTKRLRSLINTAALASCVGNTAAGGCLRTSDALGAYMQLQVIPLRRDLERRPWQFTLVGSCVAVFISTATAGSLPWDRLSAMYGLTCAEAKLASRLADGVSLEIAATALVISIHTARSQLKVIFAKTGVTRQAELVALLLTDFLSHPQK